MTAPLADITVLDLTHVLAGPYATMILADLGARVIKVERPGLGDDTRAFPPIVDGQSAYFATINRGKSSIALDLKSPEDRVTFDALLARADILVENYRPGVMDRLGLGWDTLHARFPALIYGASSGFGHTGPDSQHPCYDMVVQARAGVMSITGEDGREPVRAGASIGDIVAGLFLANGLMAALHDRARTGLGRFVDVAMLDGQYAILEHAIALTGETGIAPGPNGARHPSITPFETFHARDGLFVIAAGNDALFGKLCDLLDLPLKTDPRFASNAARCTHHALLKRLIEAVTLGQPKAHWIAALRSAGIPTGPIQTIAEAMTDPQLIARNMIATVPQGDRVHHAAGNPIKMSGLEDSPEKRPAPLLDADRAAILQWLEEPSDGK
ncbi:CoA:oxalate CoA-transferase [Rubricella aquisinus]|uniref:CoA:oxalate CoA-transferase n=1 Tax=Rubricella aquisinus TaxID=2028108 RepID=A0A840WMN0_9RHOB|nr:CoA transferase [Rubricella aquisinus]MBB5514912.1 CoA:oxalate CoA-transferase [Rubricella aquisinus]